MNHQLFNILPNNFFSILSSEHHETYADCIFLLYHFLGKGSSFGADKEELTSLLTDYYENYAKSMEKTSSAREKAQNTLRRLKQCGWTFEEDEANYQVLINFTYYAIPIIKSLIELKTSDELEYLGYIFLIYSAVKNIDKDNLNDLIDQINHNTNIVMCKLKTLNANIKKYMLELLNKKSRNDLKSIASNLFVDYKENIIDESYHRLKTSDNVSKYRPFIISKLNDICIDHNLIEEVSQDLVHKKKYADIGLAKKSLFAKIDSIITSFLNMDDIIAEIDRKNTKYIQMSISKISFIVNNKKNLQGKIYHILRSIATNKNGNSIANLYSLMTHKQVNQDSIYTMPRKSVLNQIKIDPSICLSQLEKDKRLVPFMRQNELNKNSIISYVASQLKNKKRRKASELPLNCDLDYIRLILIYMYSKSMDMNYTIEASSVVVISKPFIFNEFIIVRK